jgi:hypothetical protein
MPAAAAVALARAVEGQAQRHQQGCEQASGCSHDTLHEQNTEQNATARRNAYYFLPVSL